MNRQKYYEILGLLPGATEQEIKQKYKQEALKWHPDKNPSPEAEERFKLVGEAYQELTKKTSQSHPGFYMDPFQLFEQHFNSIFSNNFSPFRNDPFDTFHDPFRNDPFFNRGGAGAEFGMERQFHSRGMMDPFGFQSMFARQQDMFENAFDMARSQAQSSSYSQHTSTTIKNGVRETKKTITRDGVTVVEVERQDRDGTITRDRWENGNLVTGGDAKKIENK